jgi:hypothetical protein
MSTNGTAEAETYDEVARRAGPKTSRKGAKKLPSATAAETWAVIVEHQPIGQYRAMTILAKQYKDRGLDLYQDPVTGHFNTFFKKGKIVPTGKTEKNPSGKEAIRWRVAKKDERNFLVAYRGDGFPSADDLVERWMNNPEIKAFLEAHSDPMEIKLLKAWWKGYLLATLCKDYGIKWFMRRYNTKGKRIPGTEDLPDGKETE